MIEAIGSTGRSDPFHSRSAKCLAACVAFLLVPMIGPAVAAGEAAGEDGARAVFDRFVTAQNSHDVEAVGALLIDSPEFLWITRGAAVWGEEAALARFASLYEGAWRLAPDDSGMKVMMIGEGAAQIFVPIDFTIGAPGEQPQQTLFLMNMVLTETADGWKISSILPIPAPTR
jgi:hypothetical protein